jgi:ABC-type nitrate/sulfonate/bicarbonate transport system substrate-binding protein
MHRMRFVVVLVAIIALAIPVPALAAVESSEPSATATLDTPAPPAATPAPTPRPKRTPKPKPKPKPTTRPAAINLPITPGRRTLTVGYGGKDVVRRAPLLVAELSGYFDDVGLDRVTLSRSGDPLAGLLAGDLDIAVVDKQAAAAAAAEITDLRVIAGYRNYPNGEYGGDMLLAAPRLIADEPATVIAFLSAYVTALQDLSKPRTASRALKSIGQADVRLSKETRADWPEALGAYAPFDGGFGSLEDGDGMAEFTAYLTEDEDASFDSDALIATHTLSIAQAWSGLQANPTNLLVGPPGITDLTIGMAAQGGADSPIAAALDAGYFEQAGFESVEVLDVEQPLLGVLQGELDFGVLDASEAADGSAQGLPLVALAGHRNYTSDGTYGGDLVVASSDVLGDEGSTVSAFLVAYVRALRDLTTETSLAPHDGGFGERSQSGGLGELDMYLQAVLGAEPDLGTLIESAPLTYAQAWWGLPANPTPSEEAE